jgi:hypothetical protein
MSLGLGPRLQRILAHLIAHPEWEADASLEIIRFRILDRGVTARVDSPVQTQPTDLGHVLPRLVRVGVF